MFFSDGDFWTIAIPVISVALINGYIAGTGLNEAYTKVPGMPSSWLFIAAWTICYIAIIISHYLAYSSIGSDSIRSRILNLLRVQLALQFIWVVLAFYSPKLSIIVLGLMILFSIGSMYYLYTAVNGLVGYVKYAYMWYLPYMIWLVIALFLAYKYRKEIATTVKSL